MTLTGGSEYVHAKKLALYYLARQSLTTMELAQKLQRKGIPSEIGQRILDEFAQQGYFDDSDWVKRYIEGQMRQGRGPSAIKQKLRLKGIPPALIAEQMEACQASHLQGEQIQQLMQTRYRNRDLREMKERRKVVGSLVRRGFALEEIFRVLSISNE